MNTVNLTGRLTKQPEVNQLPNGGKSYSRFTIAVNRSFSNQQGDREADFINCVAWGKLAENLATYQKKGSLIGVTGRIQTGSYIGQDSKKVYTTDVVASDIEYLEKARSNNNSNSNNSLGAEDNGNIGAENQYSKRDPFEVSGDDLPF